MPNTIENTEINEFFKMLQEQHHLTSEKRFTITYDLKLVETGKPPYDVPKKYSNRVKSILNKAKADLKEKKEQGYSRDDAVKDFFEAQDKFSQHIKDQQCQ